MVMNTTTKSPLAGVPSATTPLTTTSAPISSCLRSESAYVAGSGSIAAVIRRKSSSTGSGSKGRNPVVGSLSTSSKSAPTEDSIAEPADPRIIYGRGKISCLPTELGRLRASAPLIVSSPSRITLARRIQSLIPNLDSRILDSAVVNVPAHVVDDAVSRIDDRDAVISVGGASAIGLAKAIGCRKVIPHVCIPTTYSGSEMMPLLLDACPARHSSVNHATGGNSSKSEKQQRRHRDRDSLTHGKRKSPRTTSFRDPRVLPSVVIYDEDLTMSVPRRVSAPTEVIAIARSVESRKEDDISQWSYLHLPGV